MSQQNVSTLGMAEIFMKGTSDFRMTSSNGTQYMVHLRGGEVSRKGVGLIVKAELDKQICQIRNIDETILGCILTGKPKNTLIIQVYFPTSDCSEEMSMNYFNKVENQIKLLDGRQGRPTIVMGDFNSSVGEGEESSIVGCFALGKRNDKGQLLVEYCKQEEFTIRSTYGTQPKKRRYTWIRSDGKVKSQIDYMLINNRYRSSLTKCRPINKPDCGADHNMVVGNYRIKLNKRWNGKKTQKHDLKNLKNTEIRVQYCNKIEKGLVKKDSWEVIKSTVKKVAAEIIGYTKQHKKQPWITDEILHLINNRNNMKKTNANEYKEISREIQKKCRAARTKWIEVECREIENLESKNNTREMHKRIKAMSYKTKHTETRALLSKTGKKLTEAKEIGERWKEYMNELYAGPKVREQSAWNIDDRDHPTDQEVQKALAQIKNKKRLDWMVYLLN